MAKDGCVISQNGRFLKRFHAFQKSIFAPPEISLGVYSNCLTGSNGEYQA